MAAARPALPGKERPLKATAGGAVRLNLNLKGLGSIKIAQLTKGIRVGKLNLVDLAGSERQNKAARD